MKKVVSLGLMLLFTGAIAYAQQGTYSNEGPIVEHVKAAVAAYNAGDWAKYRSTYAGTAQFHVNSQDPISLDERMTQLTEGLAAYESYAINEPLIGHIHTAEGQDWGVLWAAWTGTPPGASEPMTIMIHTAVRFENGKGVEMWGFWDQPDEAEE